MRRRVQFAPGFYYHLCNKSNDGSSIFLDDRDYARMLFFILFYQFSTPFFNIGRSISYFEKHTKFNISEEEIKRLLPARVVELSAFAIMPNHFHLLIQEKEKGGISRYLQRLQGGYAKYFNTRYQRGGHVFRGSFRAVPVEKEISYPWSSYQDFAKENRWEELLNPAIILDQFSSMKAHKEFVETSSAKLKENEVQLGSLFLE